MKVLITGAAGMVGSHCAEFYARRGNQVYALDSLIRSKLFGSPAKSVEYNWDYLGKFENIKRVKIDIRDWEPLKELFEANEFDLIIHTAAQPGVGFSLKDPKQDFQINAVGTFNLLELTRRYSKGATFIYCSTNKVYGERVLQFELIKGDTRYAFKSIKAIREDIGIDLTAHTPYGVSKYVGDIYCQEYGYSYGIRTGVFRTSCIYGPRQFGFEDQGWVAWFSISALKDRKITIYGDGKQVRDVLYVDDLVRAFDLYYRSNLKHAVFNIGGGPQNTISLLELLDLLERKLGKKIEREFSDWRPSDQRVYISDITKLKENLGWEPSISIEEGLERMLSWMKDNLDLFE
jgi:CDP-paratose 2-epimerase